MIYVEEVFFSEGKIDMLFCNEMLLNCGCSRAEVGILQVVQGVKTIYSAKR
jgi:hypothetical protein